MSETTSVREESTEQRLESWLSSLEDHVFSSREIACYPMNWKVILIYKISFFLILTSTSEIKNYFEKRFVLFARHVLHSQSHQSHNFTEIRGNIRLSFIRFAMHRGADKSLARPGRKQANVSVRMAWISFGFLPCRKKKLDDGSRLDVVEIARVPDMLPSLFPSWLS